MKTILRRGHRHHIKIGFFAVALILFSGLYNQAEAQTIDIGPNQYAFRFTGNPNFGLFFNSTNLQYEFRNGSAAPIFAIGAAAGDLRSDLSFASGSDFLVGANRYAFRYSGDPDFGLYFNDTDSRYEFMNGGANPIFGFSALNGQMTTDLQFDGTASYIVAPNNYAIRSTVNANLGLYFGPIDYEFRNAAGNSVLNINANTGEIVSTAGIAAEGIEIEAESGQVSINSTGFLGGISKVGFSNLGTENGYVQMSLGILQIMNTTEFGAIAFGNNNELHSIFDGDGRLCINTNIPDGRLTVIGKGELTEDVINATVTYNGTADVTAISAVSVPTPGHGFGVSATGGYMGVRGTSSAFGFSGTTYGIYGTAIGTSGTHIGVYGNASGGTTNWAMYAAGDSYVSGDLRVGNQTDVSGFRFSVDGRAICEELKVQVSGDWPDYVFADDYSMMNLNELEDFIKTENHLPGVPSSAEVEEADGIMLGEMQRVTIEKLEELTLYILELKKENDLLKERVEALEN